MTTKRGCGRAVPILGLLASGALVLAGCGGLVPPGDPGTEGPVTEEPTTDGGDVEGQDSDGQDLPEGFDPDLPRFEVGEVVQGAAEDDPWEAVLVVQDPGVVLLDVRNEFGGDREGRREVIVTDAAGEELARNDTRRFLAESGGQPAGDPVGAFVAEPGEYLVSVPVQSGAPARDLSVLAFVPPVVQVGDRFEAQVRNVIEQDEAHFVEGELFVVEFAEPGTYTVEILEADFRALLVVYTVENIRTFVDDLGTTEEAGLLTSDFEAGHYVIQVLDFDGRGGPAQVEVRAGT